jgi:GTP-binding protein EngB required for normal cell division
MAEVLTSIPHLCVVGHPNRGKSSIVSTLTENDSVRIGRNRAPPRTLIPLNL